MTEDWFVPGAAIFDGLGHIRLRPPEDWVRVVLDIPRTPPSMNTDALRGWRSFAKLKKEWQQEITTLLMVEKVKRTGYQRAIAGTFMRFATAKKQRDPPNFAGLVTKALADALVEYGAIPDDDAPHYVFGGVEFEDEHGPNRTRIVVFLQPHQEED